ncbi:class F sortase [Kitasatospora sp. NPDC002040]|uniref:class F sortase n=1 Tax=Kitasatospora sp. NPDC002040 TaxID=3154661 RepID=UPI00332CEE67
MPDRRALLLTPLPALLSAFLLIGAGCGTPLTGERPRPAPAAVSPTVVSPPAPAPAAAPDPIPPAPGPADPPLPDPLPDSPPVGVDIPAIGVHAPLVPLGLDPAGMPQAPTMKHPEQAGWLTTTPAPGTAGAAVLIGHLDTRTGPAIFLLLQRLRPGDTVSVRRADRRTAQFTVDSVEDFPQAAFPADRVYQDPGHPALRLVTCGGPFDRRKHTYRDNTVVFAHLTGTATD